MIARLPRVLCLAAASTALAAVATARDGDVTRQFTPEGIELSTADWTLQLRLEAFGHAGALDALPAAERSGSEYRRGPVTEWFESTALGLEQWFTVAERGEGAGALELSMRIEGGLTVDVMEGGLGARFLDGEGRPVLNYTGLKVWDAEGTELHAALAAGCDTLSILVDDRHAVYPVTIDPTFWVQRNKIIASDRLPEEGFGDALSFNGDTLLVGASKADINYVPNQGAAYVYYRDAGGPGAWGEITKITASDGAATDRFGRGLALDGDTAVIGAFRDDYNSLSFAGSAYVYYRDQGGADNWGEVVKLTPADAQGKMLFGISAAISGDTIVVGAMRQSESGAVYVFERDLGGPDNWGESAKILASDGSGGDRFGSTVAIDGDTIVVGSFKDDHGPGTDVGSAYVFVRNGTIWDEQAKLVASDATVFSLFGNAVEIDGDTAVIGAALHDLGPIQNPGAAYVFTRSGTVWTEEQRLTASNAVAEDRFGRDVSIEGDKLAVGSYFDDQQGITNLGSVYMYFRSGTTWTQEANFTSSDPLQTFNFGQAVHVQGTDLAVGSASIDSTGNFKTGSVYMFEECCPPTVNYCTAGISANGCQATITASGQASASAKSGFTLTANGVEGTQDGSFFFSTNGRKAKSWGNGTSWFCMIVPVNRAGLVTGSGTAGLCDGVLSQDLNAHWCGTCQGFLKNPGAGTTVQAQVWYRDPFNTSNQTTSLSDAIEFTLAP